MTLSDPSPLRPRIRAAAFRLACSNKGRIDLRVCCFLLIGSPTARRPTLVSSVYLGGSEARLPSHVHRGITCPQPADLSARGRCSRTNLSSSTSNVLLYAGGITEKRLQGMGERTSDIDRGGSEPSGPTPGDCMVRIYGGVRDL